MRINGKARIKTKLRVNDSVRVICGRDRGKEGKVLQINTHRNIVTVSGINMAKKAMRRRKQEDKGGVVDIECPLHISNVQFISKGKSSRVRYEIGSGREGRRRKAVKTGELL